MEDPKPPEKLPEEPVGPAPDPPGQKFVATMTISWWANQNGTLGQVMVQGPTPTDIRVVLQIFHAAGLALIEKFLQGNNTNIGRVSPVDPRILGFLMSKMPKIGKG